jgi:hypothetical protein
MKAPLFIKLFLVLPSILFADYLLMSLLGCATCLFGLGEEFYCGPFCIVGKLILVLSAILFGYICYPDIRKALKSKKNGASAKKQESLHPAQNERI